MPAKDFVVTLEYKDEPDPTLENETADTLAAALWNELQNVQPDDPVYGNVKGLVVEADKGWHSVKDSLPPDNHDVLVIRKNKITAQVGWYGTGWYVYQVDEDGDPIINHISVEDVEYWQPYPYILPNGRDIH